MEEEEEKKMLIKFPVEIINKSRFNDFIQCMADRVIQGHFRYGEPNRRKKYLKRLKLELKEYEKTGNMEQLINIAVYCHLETCEPENPLFHYNNLVDSVTRNITK